MRLLFVLKLILLPLGMVAIGVAAGMVALADIPTIQPHPRSTHHRRHTNRSVGSLRFAPQSLTPKPTNSPATTCINSRWSTAGLRDLLEVLAP